MAIRLLIQAVRRASFLLVYEGAWPLSYLPCRHAASTEGTDSSRRKSIIPPGLGGGMAAVASVMPRVRRGRDQGGRGAVWSESAGGAATVGAGPPGRIVRRSARGRLRNAPRPRHRTNLKRARPVAPRWRFFSRLRLSSSPAPTPLRGASIPPQAQRGRGTIQSGPPGAAWSPWWRRSPRAARLRRRPSGACWRPPCSPGGPAPRRTAPTRPQVSRPTVISRSLVF
jgi:hypothetical protein